jgi:hypothetical protein
VVTVAIVVQVMSETTEIIIIEGTAKKEVIGVKVRNGIV